MHQDCTRQASDTHTHTHTNTHMNTHTHTHKHNPETVLLMWFKDTRAQQIPISGSILQEKAKEYGTGLGSDDFHFSDGCFYGFKHCYHIQFCVISGESGDIINVY